MKYALLGFTVATVVWVTSPDRGAPQDQERWSWRGRVAAGRTLEIRGVNGTILAERAQGGEIEVLADRHGRRDDPEEVRLEVIEHDGGVTICAVYPGRRNRCAPGGGTNSVQNNDVQVDFTVRVPAGVRFEGYTVNGDVEALNLDGPADVQTVNGGITTDFPVQVTGRLTRHRMNGQIGQGGRALRVATVNGAIRLRRIP